MLKIGCLLWHYLMNFVNCGTMKNEKYLIMRTNCAICFYNLLSFRLNWTNGNICNKVVIGISHNFSIRSDCVVWYVQSTARSSNSCQFLANADMQGLLVEATARSTAESLTIFFPLLRLPTTWLYSGVFFLPFHFRC
jgi:hypothetical protein